MAPSNFNRRQGWPDRFQSLIIEDSWEGTVHLEARLLRSWQGVCGSHRLLEDRAGHFYWWTVFFAPEGGSALQRLVRFLDWDSVAEALGISETWRRDERSMPLPLMH